MDESIEMCRIAFRDGIHIVVAAPHTLGGVYDNDVETILDALDVLRKELQNTELEMQILPGSEMHVNPAVLDMIRDGRVLTINRMGKAVMLEFPKFFVPDVMGRFLESLAKEGIIPIISHPERTPKFAESGMLRDMVQMGALTQVTAGSLTGGFGAGPEYLARSLLKEGLVHLIASDGHSVHQRPPVLSKAVKVASKILGMDRAKALVRENPLCILRGARPQTIEEPVAREIRPSARPSELVSASMQTVEPQSLEHAVAPMQNAAVPAHSKAVQQDPATTLIISVLSSKGGVGKTHFSINLACALAESGNKVLLIDADLGNADISNKIDASPEHHLLDFLHKQRRMEDLIFETDFNFDVICGMGGETQLANLNYGQRRRFVNNFQKASLCYDFAIFDLGSGVVRMNLDFALAADRTVIVATPQDAHSGYTCAKACFSRFKDIELRLEKSLSSYAPQRTFPPMLLLNQVSHLEQARKIFHKIDHWTDERINAHEDAFKIEMEYLGAIPYDRARFLRAEARKKPLLLDSPNTKISQCIRHMSVRFLHPKAPYDPAVKFREPFRRFVSILSQKV
jgi:protein-tyrosine phosphatase